MMQNMRTTQKWCRLLRPVKNSAGMTMVEVLIAFAVLMLVLALANTAVQTSLNLSNMAENVRQKTESVLTGYYRANRAASETSCKFGDFNLKTYPGVYNDETTGYSIYWFHDGKDHTPPLPQQGDYPAWLPKGLIYNWAIDGLTGWGSWTAWWDDVVEEQPTCAAQWIELMNGRNSLSTELRWYVYGWGNFEFQDGRLCPP